MSAVGSVADRHLESLPSDPGRMLAIPIDSSFQSFLEAGARLETELALRPGYVHTAARLTIRLGRIPHYLAFEPDFRRDRRGQVLDGDLHTGADIHRIRFVVPLRRQNDTV